MELKAVFWDLDGTLVDSEPVWHQGEIEIAHANGGEWTVDDGWAGSGTPVPDVARRMIAKGCTLTVEQIDKQLKQYVFDYEQRHLPWIDGVLDVVKSLKAAGVPSMVVSTSPRPIVDNVIQQADGLFAGYVCGDDPVAHKPDPAPYLEAARRLGLTPDDMPACIVLEDSASGLRSGVASGATVIAQTGWIRTDTSGLGQFASIDSYDGITAETLDGYVCQRLGKKKE